MARSERHCLRTTRRHSKSFYFASYALPRPKKVAAYAVYAFCRYVDDLIDVHASSDGGAAVRRVQEAFDRLSSGEVADPPFAPAFAHAVRTYGLPKGPFLDLTRGVLTDTGPVALPDWASLRDYCYSVASVVGLMMCPILGLRDERGQAHAVELGIAMQLTNILRDVREDGERGRVYLPKQELDRFGITADDLAQGRVTEAFRAFMRFQVARAREYYARAEAGIPSLADDGSQLTVWIMRHVYAGILDEIERQGYNVFRRRAHTSMPRKIGLAARAHRDCRLTRARGRRPDDPC